MTGNIEESEDILQTAFLNAYKAFDNFRYESSVYTWLYKIVLNTSKKFYREARKLPVEEYSETHNITEADNTAKAVGEIIHNDDKKTVYRGVYTVRTPGKTCFQEVYKCSSS